MKTWTDVAFEYFENGIISACPCCGENKVQVLGGEVGNRIWFDFVCDACKETEHFDGFAD